MACQRAQLRATAVDGRVARSADRASIGLSARVLLGLRAPSTTYEDVWVALRNWFWTSCEAAEARSTWRWIAANQGEAE